MILLSCGNLRSQDIERFYFGSGENISGIDKVLGTTKVDDGIIVGGINFEPNPNEFIVVKLNLNGNIIWSTSDNTEFLEHMTSVKFEVTDDGYVYALPIANQFPGNDWYRWIMRINGETGIVEWIKEWNSQHNSELVISDYDSTSLLVAHFVSTQGYEGEEFIVTLSKETGQISDSYLIREGNQGVGKIMVDASKNVYRFSFDNIIKYNANNFEQIIWESNLDNPNFPMESVYYVHMDKYDDIYAFGGDGAFANGFYEGVVKIDNQTGKAIWGSGISASDLVVTNITEDNDFIYPLYRNPVITANRYYTAKIEKSTGLVYWENSEGFEPYENGWPVDGSARGLSISVDCQSNVYITGYFDRSSNAQTKTWGMMKFNGSTGEVEFDQRVSDNPNVSVDNGEGIGAFCFGDRAFFIGHQDNYDFTTYEPFFIELDPESGEITSKIDFESIFQDLSETTEIHSHDNTNIVLKQLGDKAILEVMDNDMEIEWDRDFSSQISTYGGQVDANSDYVFVSTFDATNEDIHPYLPLSTSLIEVHKLDREEGFLYASKSIEIDNTSARPYEIEEAGEDLFIFYVENDSAFVVKWDFTSVDNANFLTDRVFLETRSLTYSNRFKFNTVYNNSANDFLVISTSEGLMSLNKNTMDLSLLNSDLPQGTYNYSISTDNDLYIIGRSELGFQLMVKINLQNWEIQWAQEYGADGFFNYIIKSDSNRLFVAGQEGNHSSISEIQSENGEVIWAHIVDTIAFPVSNTYSLGFIESANQIIAAGSSINSDGSSEVIISTLNSYGSLVSTEIEVDEFGLESFASAIAEINESTVWIGGRYNSTASGKKGFIYQLTPTQLLGCMDPEASNYNPQATIPGLCYYEFQEPVQTLTEYSTQGQLGGINEEITIGVDNQRNRALSVFPNPVRNTLFINGLRGNEYRYQIYDIQGRVVDSRTNFSKTEIDVSSLGNALYLIKIIQNGVVEEFRFVKQ